MRLAQTHSKTEALRGLGVLGSRGSGWKVGPAGPHRRDRGERVLGNPTFGK